MECQNCAVFNLEHNHVASLGVVQQVSSCGHVHVLPTFCSVKPTRNVVQNFVTQKDPALF